MNLLQQADDIKKSWMKIYSEVVTRECCYRGSSLSFVWIPDRNIRE